MNSRAAGLWCDFRLTLTITHSCSSVDGSTSTTSIMAKLQISFAHLQAGWRLVVAASVVVELGADVEDKILSELVEGVFLQQKKQSLILELFSLKLVFVCLCSSLTLSYSFTFWRAACAVRMKWTAEDFCRSNWSHSNFPQWPSWNINTTLKTETLTAINQRIKWTKQRWNLLCFGAPILFEHQTFILKHLFYVQQKKESQTGLNNESE